MIEIQMKYTLVGFILFCLLNSSGTYKEFTFFISVGYGYLRISFVFNIIWCIGTSSKNLPPCGKNHPKFNMV